MTLKQVLTFSALGLVIGAIIGHEGLLYTKKKIAKLKTNVACGWLEERATDIPDAVLVLKSLCWKKQGIPEGNITMLLPNRSSRSEKDTRAQNKRGGGVSTEIRGAPKPAL